jgi:NADH dehydrogenase
MSASSTVLVTGACGFIGRHLVAALAAQGWSVRALSRDPSRAPREVRDAAALVKGDLRDADALREALRGASALVHLAAAKADEPESVAINVGGAKNLVEACRAAGVARVVNVGTQASRIPGAGLYGRSKAAADAVFAASGLAVTTLRPSLVYGPGDAGAFGKLAGAVRRLPLVPLLGGAGARFWPVDARDLSRAIAACLRAPSTAGKTYDVGGPQPATMAELVALIGGRLGRRARTLPLPAAPFLWAAELGRMLSPRFPISPSNIIGAARSAPDADFQALWRELALTPRSLEEGLREAL